MKTNSCDTFTKKNKIAAADVVRTFLKAYINQRNWEKARRYLVDIVVWFDMFSGGISYSTNGHKQLQENMYRIHPNTRVVIGDLQETGVCERIQIVSGPVLYEDCITKDKTTLRIFIICIADDSRWKIRQLELVPQGSFEQVECMNTRIEDAIQRSCLNKSLPVSLICCRCDDYYSIVSVSERGAHLLGYDNSADFIEKSGMSVLSNVHPEDTERFVRFFKELQEDGQVQSGVFNIRRKDHCYSRLFITGYRAPNSDKLVFAFAEYKSENDFVPSRLNWKRGIYIRTFGYFDVFVNGHAIPFRSAKAKELLAVLVDRRGGFASRGDIIGCLWENEPVSSRTMTRCRKAYMNLIAELAAYGADDIVESNSKTGERHVIPDRFECDLFQYLSGEPQYRNLFHGVYLENYPWGEYTLGMLERKYEKE